jgi:hypothetical protein
LPQALLSLKHLLQQFGGVSSEGVANKALQFLHARGFKQQFDLVEQEMRDCLVQLSAVLGFIQFTAQVRAAAGWLADWLAG